MESEIQRLDIGKSTFKTTDSDTKPVSGNHAAGRVIHIPAIVQLYALTFAINQQYNPTVDWIAANVHDGPFIWR